MKLLFDENLSPRLSSLLVTIYPNSVHARYCGLLGHSDGDVWEYARENGLTIISKDSDFQQRSLLYGHPPKVIWLRIGNCSRQQLLELITFNESAIREFSENQEEALLILS